MTAESHDRTSGCAGLPVRKGATAASRFAWHALAAVLILAAIAVTGCAPEVSAPVAQVEGLLEARSTGTTDAAVYLRFLESTAVAQQLALDAESRTATSPAIPPWKSLELAQSSESTAAVDVHWTRTAAFARWPEVTRFILQLEGSRWLVVDAEDTSATATSE